MQIQDKLCVRSLRGLQERMKRNYHAICDYNFSCFFLILKTCELCIMYQKCRYGCACLRLWMTQVVNDQCLWCVDVRGIIYYYDVLLQ